MKFRIHRIHQKDKRAKSFVESINIFLVFCCSAIGRLVNWHLFFLLSLTWVSISQVRPPKFHFTSSAITRPPAPKFTSGLVLERCKLGQQKSHPRTQTPALKNCCLWHVTILVSFDVKQLKTMGLKFGDISIAVTVRKMNKSSVWSSCHKWPSEPSKVVEIQFLHFFLPFPDLGRECFCLVFDSNVFLHVLGLTPSIDYLLPFSFLLLRAAVVAFSRTYR